jgi:UDP-N-acetylmuramyl pentapeptide phosphotransferase/UDP-N-acetylglucosamine-1-phosphate transferase
VSDARTIWSLLAATAFVAAFVVVRIVERYARTLGLVDLPNLRSSHVVPRPRGGGLGIVAGVVLGLSGASVLGLQIRELSIVLGAAALVAAVGLWDDIRGLGVWPRLAVQGIAAAIVFATVGGLDRVPLPAPADVPLGLSGGIATIIWIVGVTNFFNFMDGLDGLAAGQAVITLGALAVVTRPENAAGLAVVSASATAAFLLRNWSPAKIFLGDVGSSFLGFLLAVLPLTVHNSRSYSSLVLLVGTSLTLFILDPVATLVLRARQGAMLGASHRQHAYQQFVAVGDSHASVVARLLLVALGLSVAAIAGYWHEAFAWPAVAVSVIAFAIEGRLAAPRRQPPSA